MKAIPIGLANLFLILSLVACVPAPVVKPTTVEVRVPVYVPLAAEYTADVPSAFLPSGPLANANLSDGLAQCRVSVDRANWQFGQIRARQPKGGK